MQMQLENAYYIVENKQKLYSDFFVIVKVYLNLLQKDNNSYNIRDFIRIISMKL